MALSIRLARATDEEFLWTTLYYAAHVQKDGVPSPRDIKQHPDLAKYVAGWGEPTDIGVIGTISSGPVGAVWSRLLLGTAKTTGYVDDRTPELAAAVLPQLVGRGIGTQLLEAYLDFARTRFPAVVLTVRIDNPAAKLYQRVGFQIIGEVTNRVGTKSYQMLRSFA